MTLVAALAYRICLHRRGVQDLWPPTQDRFNVIYNATMRGQKSKTKKIKTTAFEALQPSLMRFSPAKNLKSKPEYNKWFNRRISRLVKLKLSFGHAQKFVNILMKDWCAANKIAGKNYNYKFFHAPIDNIVAKSVSRYIGPEKVDLKKLTNTTSFYKRLDKKAYCQIQEGLDLLGKRLKQSLSLNFKPTPLDVEQLIWGWI
jgi:hypothetical protein